MSNTEDILRAMHAAKLVLENQDKMKQAQEIIKQMGGNQFQDIASRVTMPPLAPMKMPKLPTPVERNEYQSAGMLIRKLDDRYQAWNMKFNEQSDIQLSIIALVSGQTLIVNAITEESFHGVAIEGRLNGTDIECLVVAHQATLQLLCIAEKITDDKPKRTIGFNYSSAE